MQNVANQNVEKLRYTLHGMPAGCDAYHLGHLIRQLQKNENKHFWLHVALDDLRMEQIAEYVQFFDPDIEVVRFPAWDCLPYDRVSPNGDVLGERVEALTKMMTQCDAKNPRLIVTTVNAVLQRIPPRDVFENTCFVAERKGTVDLSALQAFLGCNGYTRTDTVREPGEYAIRGCLIDLFPPGEEEPVRIDLFGDEVETIRCFDPMTQRTTGERTDVVLRAVSELFLTPETITRFKAKYRTLFGAVIKNDPLYDAVKEGRKHAGVEHWLPLFFEKMETLFDYLPDVSLSFDDQVELARDERLKQVDDFYHARLEMQEVEKKLSASVYNPIPINRLFLDVKEWHSSLVERDVIDLSSFAATEGQKDMMGRLGRDFGDIRAQQGRDVMPAVQAHIDNLFAQKKRVVISAYSKGACDRLKIMLAEQGVRNSEVSGSWKTVEGLPKRTVGLVVLNLEKGFETPDLAVITEQDILGDRLVRPQTKKRKSDNFLTDLGALTEGDYVVHEEHGIGQFETLESVTVNNVPHDCLKIIYSGGDRLFVPVENIEVLSRYGSEDAGGVMDKLGGAGWQARKAKVKKDLMAMAEELLKIAAARILQTTEKVFPPQGGYEQFCAGFPYIETEDQLRAIEDVVEDFAKGMAMDRLVCGDVGFGKTEIALRAAFVMAMAGYQVAIVAPTTLLARQHYQNFIQRFKDFPLRIQQLSRLVSPTEAKRVKDELVDGSVNIVVGTHALLAEKVNFDNLGLLIVDEEQRFGVKQKERLKKLQKNIHVLTLTATPIPRTLQMSLTGVKDLSLMATPPVDRLAVRTFILPFDPVVVREALMREHYRGGQSFYVCPRISDIAEIETNLRGLVPELKVIVAHGQMTATALEERISAFYEGQYDVLLATNIIEAGIDIPNVNTIILHRSEMFGLAQLYQLRGRIGRSKVRGYAYMTYNPEKKLTKTATKRLEVLEQLNTLGAGFQLASHDMEIRGGGNLLGEEQSGHIKEIGVELYQQMLEEAVAAAREGTSLEELEDNWVPQIDLGTPVLIPGSFVEDLNVRLALYRRISELATVEDINSFAAELVDRFGEMPDEVQNLLDIVTIKQLCRHAGVEKFDAGPKGAVVTFRNDQCDYVDRLIPYISENVGTVKLRPNDQKLVFRRPWSDTAFRVAGARNVLKELVNLSKTTQL